jgi:hypothetical protein
VNSNFSRRKLLKTVSAISVVPLFAGMGSQAEDGHSVAGGASSTLYERATRKEDLVELTSGEFVAAFDKRNGTLYSIRSKRDSFGTNFLGNSDNTGGMEARDTHWTGDVVSTVWRLKTKEWLREQSAQYPAPYFVSGVWAKESTLASADTRNVVFDGSSFCVRYEGSASGEGGIQSFRLTMKYRFGHDASLLWDIEIENTTDRTLELGELALPLRANDDYALPYKEGGSSSEIQRSIYEQKVLAHAFVGGHSSYVLLQRPSGDGPFLLLQCMQDTAFECIYKTKSEADTWIGTDLLAIHSTATKDLRDWGWNPWVNGHTSLVLDPGQKKSYQFRFAFVRNYSDIREELLEAGNLGVRVLPSMVVQENTDAYVELQAKADLDDIEFHSDGILLKEKKRVGDKTLLTFAFTGRGQKTIKLLYGSTRWTKLHFYCVEDAEQLIKARGRFMAERQFYVNPKDPYHRNHLFLPFDYRRGTRFDENDDVWEVGGTDDPGFGDPLFLAEKNVYLPCRDEIEKLEVYVSDCLFKYIQDPYTFEVRASLYWKERTPSSPRGSWSQNRSEATWRNYNYCFVANFYHAMYRIGREYGVLTHRTASEYLRMCYRTALKWFASGPYRHFGLITGSNAVCIVQDLQREGWDKEYTTLLNLMKECNQHFVQDPYPYKSEMEIDETGQHQVYYFTRYFGALGDPASKKKNLEVLKVLEASRGGDQPAWFLYGNDLFAHPDLRGQISCWHSESLNGMALLQGFEDTGDPAMLLKGYAGVMSVLHNVLLDGMGFGWFRLDPGVFACEPPKTFEGGPGLWGFVRAAKSYVVLDDSFGLMGYGCQVSELGDELTIVPKDGIRKRIRVVDERLDVEVSRGEVKKLRFNRRTRELQIEIEDTTGIVQTAQITVKGLAPGKYYLMTRTSQMDIQATNELIVSAPIADATMLKLSKL